MDWVFIERSAWATVHVVVAIWFGWQTLKAVRLGINRYLASTEQRNATEVAAMAQGVAVMAKIEESLRRQYDRQGEIQASCTRTELLCQGQSRPGATQPALPRHQPQPPEPGS